MPGFFALVGFGPQGWGLLLLSAALMTVLVSLSAFAAGIVFGLFGAWGKLSRSRLARGAADFYTTVLRGIPDLLVIYLFYFGGSQVLSAVAHLFGAEGFVGMSGFLVGALAVGVVSGAYETEVLRAAFLAIPPGELEAARAVGMGRLLMLRRIVGPRLLRFALPGMGNIWQQVLKESALISVTGLVELMRQTQIGAGSTRLPFDFYIAGGVLYLTLTTITGVGFRGVERWTARGMRAA